MSTTSALIARCLDLYAAVPDPLSLHEARRCLLDGFAVALAAADEKPIAILRHATVPSGAPPTHAVIGQSERVPEESAARINGMMIALLLFDDNNGPMWGHPTAPLLPPVLAIGESDDLDSSMVLRAFIVGYEVECRLGSVLNPSQYEAGWHATATQGTLGAFIAAALLRKLPAERMAQGLGIAASLVGGLRRNFGSMTMSLHAGEAASAAIRAVRLVEAGFTAHPDAIGAYGAALSREWNEAALVADLPRWGAPPLIQAPIFKLNPCGQPTLYAVECVLRMMRRDGVTAADVREIECRVSYMFPRTLIHRKPVNGLQGKTSLEYCVAATLVDDGPRIASFTDAAVVRPQIARLIDATRVVVPPELAEDVPGNRERGLELPVTVIIRTHDGRELSETTEAHRGMPALPASDQDLIDKFTVCAGSRYPGDRGREILDAMTQGITIRRLLSLVRPEGAA